MLDERLPKRLEEQLLVRLLAKTIVKVEPSFKKFALLRRPLARTKEEGIEDND
jgi:hypothetical protein